MSEPLPRIDPASRPTLPRGVRLVADEARGGWTLLGPERVFQVDAIAHEILRRCDGQTSLAEIVDDLARTFAAPRERIAADVEALLTSLRDKRIIDLA